MTIRSITVGAVSAILLLAALAPADAAPGGTAAGFPVTKVAATDATEAAAQPVHPVATVDRDDDATCSRMRRRLWIEGEGWVVRRITTCR